MKQLNFLDVLFPKTKSYYEIQQEKEDNFENTIANFSFDEKIIARSRPWNILHYYSNESIAEIKQAAMTRKQLYKSENKEIWYYDKYCDVWNAEIKQYDEVLKKQFAFRIDNEVIAITFGANNDDICFPALAMVYCDADGNVLPFTIRDDFLEEKLGLLKHGEYRLSGKPRKDENVNFASLKTTLEKIICFFEVEHQVCR